MLVGFVNTWSKALGAWKNSAVHKDTGRYIIAQAHNGTKYISSATLLLITHHQVFVKMLLIN